MAQSFKAETLKVLNDIFKHEYRRSKELNAEVHCAHTEGIGLYTYRSKEQNDKIHEVKHGIHEDTKTV